MYYIYSTLGKKMLQQRTIKPPNSGHLLIAQNFIWKNRNWQYSYEKITSSSKKYRTHANSGQKELSQKGGHL